MADIMRPVPFKELIKRMFDEYKVKGTIFGIPKAGFYRKTNQNRVEVFGEKCDTPVGPAAGPHTQLAQNIITAYLTGGRFFELKTVQILDKLEVSKPCIEPTDECFNCEWSSEYTLEKAYDEYVKAWILLYVLEDLFELRCSDEKSFLFNMSVGYDLKGIKEPRVDNFIVKMMESKGNDVFEGYLKDVKEIIADGSFLKGTDVEGDLSKIANVTEKIDSVLCKGITLSTMHGCPPKEIEQICNYMLTEKKLNTFVKLNPTLLGFPKVRAILDGCGFNDVELSEDDFSHDLQYDDAVAMLKRLVAVSKEQNLKFGVKMTNTLSSVNNRGILPDDAMYMSGRALFPISINVGKKLSNEFKGELPISFSGGAHPLNIDKIFGVGIQPITMATDILKPGGYLRFKDAVKVADNAQGRTDGKIDVAGINALAEEALTADYTQKDFRGKAKISTGKKLPMFDCYVAPCVTACPVNQDVPEYIRLVGLGKYKEAMEVIYDKNALPSITAHICDHACQYNCTRLDYEGTVQIRRIKKIAVENGFADYKAAWTKPELSKGVKVAVIGAGPAGLGAGYFLSKEGYEVTIMDKAEDIGGVVRNIIPQFRIPEETIMQDIDFIKAHGVKFEMGVDPDFSVEDLKAKGYKYVVLGLGAEAGNPLPLEGDVKNVIPSLKFLASYHANPAGLEVGENVVVVGAGNTAMDSARAAKRLDGVKSVQVVYRRTLEEMPADIEEYEEAVEDGVDFNFLTNPESVAGGKMVCRVMELGEPDESGRRRPVATDKTVEIAVDTLITAIGEKVDVKGLEKVGLKMEKGWPVINEETCETSMEGVFLLGDAHTGPSSIISAVGDARKATAAICKKENSSWTRVDATEKYKQVADLEKIVLKKGEIVRPAAADASDDEVRATELKRCVACNYVCNKCVDVCPNRANTAIPVGKELGWNNPYQILHIDAYCNECGNCGQFCPHDGKPFIDKMTVFSREDDFTNSKNSGFLQTGSEGKIRLGDVVASYSVAGGKVSCDNADMAEMVKMIELINAKFSYLLGPVGE